jgi:NADH dehydrogenase FAD-containing subunit
MKRRELCKRFAAGAAAFTTGAALATLGACAGSRRAAAAPRVVVIGGGFGGATAAKYIRWFSNYTIDVQLVEPNAKFISTPLSNRVITGDLTLAALTSAYAPLGTRHGVTVIRDRAIALDLDRRRVRLAGGASLPYDKLVLAPGIEPMFDAVSGLAAASASGAVLQAWVAGPETTALQAQLAAMPDGGVFAITVPETPYRCPPAPYERASLVAAYCARFKPRSKVLVLDANQDVVAMGVLFKSAWAELYGSRIEYRNHCKVVSVDTRTSTLRFEVSEDVRADVLNVLPPVRAAAVVRAAGLANVNERWCAVDFASFESTAAEHVHVLGDAIQAASMMPKSGHMANGHAKVAAAAIVAALQDRPIDPEPMLTNTCYSFLSPTEVIHSAAVYGYSSPERTFKPIAGAGGTSAARSAAEAPYAESWARNIWADMLT